MRLLAAAWLLSLATGWSQTPAGLAGGDEFVGPFASWANVRSYGAQGNGTADDTQAIQSALNVLGTSGQPSILYLPAGAYKISATLTLALRANVAVIGQSPAATSIVWAGPAGGTMLALNGTPYSRFGRITWNGAGVAATLISQSWSGAGAQGGSTYVEHADEVFENAAYGIRGGTAGYQDGETTILRCVFQQLTSAGVSIENQNALDWYIWDSTFLSNALGVTNVYGGGNFQVYSSLFQNSTQADISINITSYFSVRDNFSQGSHAFFVASPIGNPAAPTTFQGNTVLDCATTPIQMGNPGPVLMLDNTFRQTAGPVVEIAEAQTSAPTARLVAIGNTYTVANPYAVQGTVTAVSEQTVAYGSVNPAIPAMPGAPLSYGRPVFELAAGANTAAIQSAINQAAALNGRRAIVHLAAGAYPVTATLIVPANTDVQLVGDGASPTGGTQIQWAGAGYGPALDLPGPSNAILRDLSIAGNGNSVGILMDNADQAGSLWFGQQFMTNGGVQAGMLVNGLANAQVEIEDAYLQSNALAVEVIGNAAPAAGTNAIYSGFSGQNQFTYNVAANGQLDVQGMWYEGAPPQLVNFSGSGDFTFDGGLVDAQDPDHGGAASPLASLNASNFAGNLALSNLIFYSRNRLAVSGSTANVLGLGLVGPPDNANYFSVAGSPIAEPYALVNSRQLTATGGSAPVADQVANVPVESAFLAQMLAPLRAIQPRALPSIPAGAGSVRMYRVAVLNHAIGAEIEAAAKPFVQSEILYTARNNFGGWVGMEFAPGSLPMRVTALGRMCAPGNSSAHSLALLTAAGVEAPGGQATVNLAGCTPGQFVYAPLAAPVILNAGTTYYLLSAETVNGDLWYDINGVASTSDGAVLGGVYSSGSSYIPVPAPNASYVPVNFLYTIDLLAPVAMGTSASPPAVAIQSPAAGATVSGTISFTAVATAQAGVASVQLAVDGAPIGAPLTAPPFTTPLNTTALANGSHTLSATVRDESGNTAAASIAITVANLAPPTISILAPAAGATIAGTVSFTAAVVAQAGVAGVQLAVDSAPFGAALTAAPFTSALDTAAWINGSHTLSATVTDGAGNSAAASIAVTIANAPAGTDAPLVLSQTASAIRNNFGGWVGMSFTVGSAPLSVASLGRMAYIGNTQTHAVKLVAASSGTDVAGGAAMVAMAGSTPGQYVYAALASPITLAAGTNYYLVSQETSGGDWWSDVAPVLPSSSSSVTGVVYSSGGGYTQIASANSSYVPPNLLYAAIPPGPFLTAFTPGAPRNNFTGAVGMQIAAGSSAVMVSALGRICVAGNSGSHTLQILAASTGAPVAGGTATVEMAGCTAGSFVWASLPAPLTLAASSVYDVVSQETSGGDLWYDAMLVTGDGLAAVNGPVYQSGASYVWIAIPSYSYGPVSFR